jgi:branched-chain amino acid transport system permease protein
MNIWEILADGLRSATGPEAAVYALAAIGLNVHYGYTGLINFGQAGYMMLGAYGVAITVVSGGPLWLGVLVALGLSVVLSLLLGIPALRLRGDYLAITTIAAAEILRLFFRSDVAEPITRGVNGIQRFADSFYAPNPIPPGYYGFGVLRWDESALWVMFWGWFLAVLGTVLVWSLMHSPWGRMITSIREDEFVARSVGKNVYVLKLQSLVIGGLFGSVAGMVLALSQQAVSTEAFTAEVTFFAYAALMLGGVGRTWGPVVGAVLFWFVISTFDSTLRSSVESGAVPRDILSDADVGIIRFVLVGMGLLALVAFMPKGILGTLRRKQTW